MKYRLNHHYIQTLLEISAHHDNLFAVIAKALIKKIQSRVRLTTGRDLAAELCVSSATLTKFIKAVDLKNLNELLLIHNQTVADPQNRKIKNQKKLYHQAAALIDAARKVFFLGVSGSLFNNQDFGLKLMRLDKWVVIPVNKYEQVGLAKLLTASDLIVMNSLSLQHP